MVVVVVVGSCHEGAVLDIVVLLSLPAEADKELVPCLGIDDDGSDKSGQVRHP